MRWNKKVKEKKSSKIHKVWIPRECIKCKDTCWLEIMRTSYVHFYATEKCYRLDLCMACGFDLGIAEKIFNEAMKNL